MFELQQTADERKQDKARATAGEGFGTGDRLPQLRGRLTETARARWLRSDANLAGRQLDHEWCTGMEQSSRLLLSAL